MYEVYEEYKGYALTELLMDGTETGYYIIKSVIRDEERILAKGTIDELTTHLGLAVLESVIILAYVVIVPDILEEDIFILIDLEMEGKLK